MTRKLRTAGLDELTHSVFSAFPLQEIALFTNRSLEDANVLVVGLGVGIGAAQFASKGLNVDVVGELRDLRIS